MIKISQVIVKKGSYPKDVILSDQTHSDIVNIVDNAGDRFVGDALVTKKRNLKIGVLTADCLPIIYADAKNHVIAVSHNGWRGIENSLIKNTISKMQKLGASFENIKCQIGPGIGPCCYEIYDYRLKIFQNKFSTKKSEIIKRANNTTYLDLKKCAKFRLLECGILASNIKIESTCTSCSGHLPSFRRDYHTKSQILSTIEIKD
ncbi:MAG: peptidoglycan editing factor PgeF [Patescibacteria group bacterium]